MKSTTATQILRADYKKIHGLFAQLRAVDLRAHEMLQGVAEELINLLDNHSRIKEEIFYPALQDVLDQNDQAILDRSYDDLQEVRRLILQLKGMRPGSDEFLQVVTDLQDVFEQHADDEESVLLSQAEQVLGSDLESIGERMLERRANFKQRHQFKAEDPAHVQNPNGGEQKRTA